MIVQMIARTGLVASPEGWIEHPEDGYRSPSGGMVNIRSNTDADLLAEMAGRLCYKSWDRPHPKTASNAGYLENIIAQRHFSVLEHASATFYIAGVSRTLTHELVRHRHLSFSQVSQRYVDESDSNIVFPPALVSPAERWPLKSLDVEAKRVYAELYRMLSRTLPRKEARQAARAALLGCQETEIIVTGNLRAWREVLEKRGTPHADREFQILAGKILAELKLIAPNTFQDMSWQSFSDQDEYDEGDDEGNEGEVEDE